MLDPQKLLVQLANIKAQAEVLALQKDAVETLLLDALQANGTVSTSVVLPTGETLKGTMVAPQRVSYDADRLKTALNKSQWGKVTSQVLDKVKLEAAVVAQVVDATVVADCATISDTKPYIKVSGKINPVQRLASTAAAVAVKNTAGAKKPAVRVRARK